VLLPDNDIIPFTILVLIDIKYLLILEILEVFSSSHEDLVP
jgi:hypothetical protein